MRTIFVLLHIAFSLQVLSPTNPDAIRKIKVGWDKQVQELITESVIKEIESLGIRIPEEANRDHIRYIYDVSLEKELPIDLVFKLVRQESVFNPEALSSKGAYGYMQLMPGTYKIYHWELFGEEFIDDHNPYKNIYIGLYYLREQWDFFGCWKLALSAYNAGPSKVIYWGGIPPYRETREYIKIIYGI